MYPTWKTCPKEFPTLSDWDDEEQEEYDQVKGEDKDEGSKQKTPQTNPRSSAVMTLTFQPSKPSISE